jgi:hypothetical protein
VDNACGSEAEENQVQNMLQKRLSEGRLRQINQKLKHQKILDNAPRYAEYEGHDVTSGKGIVRSLGNDLQIRNSITNGAILPKQSIRVNKTSLDSMPYFSAPIEEQETVARTTVEIVSEYVGNCVTYLLEQEIPVSVKKASEFPVFAAINKKDTIFSSTVEYPDFQNLPPLRDDNILGSESKVSIYRASKTLNLKKGSSFYLYHSAYRFHEQRDVSFIINEDIRSMTGKNSAYTCFCQKFYLTVVNMYFSQSYDLSRFFVNPIKGLKRTKCEELLKLTKGLDQEQKEQLLAKCRNAIEWSIDSPANGFYNTASGIVSEDGFLIIEDYKSPPEYRYFDPDTYTVHDGGFFGGFLLRINNRSVLM